MAPRDSCGLIPGPCEYITLRSKRVPADVSELLVLGWGDYLDCLMSSSEWRTCPSWPER